MKTSLFISILCCFVFTFHAPAQQVYSCDSFLQQKFDFQVKQLSQFFDRFNFKEQMPLNFNSTLSREKNLVSLINLRDTALIYNPGILEFMHLVTNNISPIYISYNDSNWYAIVHCSFLYKGQKKTADIILQPEGVVHNGYAWVIVGAKSDLFHIQKDDRNEAFLNPMNHEIGFTELSGALSDKKKIGSYTSVSYRADNLATFLFLVHNGDLQFMQINTIDYQFLQVPGWIFTVKDFDRTDFNSGWLISSVLKISEKNKKYYKINSLLN